MRGKLIAATTVVAVLVGLVAAGAPEASAANKDFIFFGRASGTTYQPFNGVPSSTAVAAVVGGPANKADSDAASGLDVSHVAEATSVATATSITKVPGGGGWQVMAQSKAKGVSLLGGAVTATSVTTTTVITEVHDVLTTNVHSAFVGLSIPGHHVPLSVPSNYTVSLGDLGEVVLNSGVSSVAGGVGQTSGAGMQLRLTSAQGSAGPGDVITVAPVSAMVQHTAPTTGHSVGGQAYGTKVLHTLDGTTTVISDPTARITMPAAGTSGFTFTTAISSVRAGTGVRTGAVTDSALGDTTTSSASSQLTSRVQAVTLFGGLIKATAVSTEATATAAGTRQGTTTFSGLVVNGHTITAPAPNTVIDVLNLGRVTVNQQVRSAHGIVVRALDIVLGVARDGLPAGAEVQVAVATATAI
jgi:hypothetical protein